MKYPSDRPVGYGMAGMPLYVRNGGFYKLLETFWNGQPVVRTGIQWNAYTTLARHVNNNQQLARAEFYARCAGVLSHLLDHWEGEANDMDHKVHEALVARAERCWQLYVGGLEDKVIARERTSTTRRRIKRS